MDTQSGLACWTFVKNWDYGPSQLYRAVPNCTFSTVTVRDDITFDQRPEIHGRQGTGMGQEIGWDRLDVNNRPAKTCLVKLNSNYDDWPINTVIEVAGFLRVDPALDGTGDNTWQHAMSVRKLPPIGNDHASQDASNDIQGSAQPAHPVSVWGRCCLRLSDLPSCIVRVQTGLWGM